MNNQKVNTIVMNAMIACVYAVLTVAIAPIAYGEIQFRISEILVLLACYNKKYIPGLVVGCFIANLFSPMMMYDITFGTCATLIACIGMYAFKNLFVGALIGGVANGILVGYELNLAFGAPFVASCIYVFIGEFAVLLIGAAIFKYLEKQKSFMEKYILE